MSKETRFSDPAVGAAFDKFPADQQAHLLLMRSLVFDVASREAAVGEIAESLKWGEPSYVPVKPKVGSPFRMGSHDTDNIALYFNCNTMLVERIRGVYGDDLVYSKNRAVLFPVNKALPESKAIACMCLALTYHRDKIRVL